MWDLWWIKWQWDRFSPVNFIPPVFHYKKERKNFITGLHNKPQGGGASVASATGPFTPPKINGNYINIILNI
jgi:hypothetical protein